MANIEDVLDLTAVASGTLNVPVQTNLSLGSFNGGIVRVSGSATLSGALNISAQGTPVANTQEIIIWDAVVTHAGNPITIFGETLSPNLSNKSFIAFCDYTGSKWVVNIAPNFSDAGIVSASNLDSDSVTTAKILDANTTLAKIQDVAANSILARDANSSGVLTEIAAATTEIFIGNGTGFTAAALSGAVTMTNAGVVSYVDASIATAKYQDASVTPTKMSANANRYTRDITLSFQQASEVGAVNFTICEDCTIDEINVTVLDPAVTDTATLIYKDNGGVVLTASQTDITTGLAIGNVVSTTPTANNVFAAGDNLLIEMSKTTKTSGKVNVALCITKT